MGHSRFLICRGIIKERYTYCTVKSIGWRWSELLIPAKAVEVDALVRSGR